MAELSYLTIEHAPNKTIYRVGDKFERYGMIVKAHYNDGTSSRVDVYAYSPSTSLTTNHTQITISAFDKTVTQNITVLPSPTRGYFADKYLGNANFGNNPYVNTVDGSISFYNNPIIVERDSYEIKLVLSYHSRMTDRESDLVKGLFKGFRTNYHQFLIADGIDENNNTTYKYIDGDGYTHTFIYHDEISKYYDKEGTGLFLDINNSSKRIIDQQNNILSFDTSGRLISIQSGLDSNNVKTIEYNSDGLRKIYDNRNPNVYIKFSYNFSFLQYIRIYYNNDNSPLKTYTLNGIFGQISSIEETVGNSTRTLYQYAVNDRDRVRRIVDCLTKVAYRITYTFDTVLNDYRFDSLRKGYLNNDEFAQHKGVYFVSYDYDSNSDYKLMRKLVIRNDNDIDLSFMTDSNGNPVIVFEQEYNNEGNYYSLIHDEGIWLGNEGNSGDRISDSTAKAFLGTLNINGLNVTKNDLNQSPTLKLVGYIKIKSHHLRAKLSIYGSFIDSRFIDINPDAYYVWQYFELPLTREIGNDKTITSFEFYLEDENDNGISAEVANLQFVESEPKQRLFFMNNNEPVALDELTRFNLEQQNGTYSPLYLSTDIAYLSGSDFINTLKRYYSHNDNPSLLYLNNGKIVKAFYGDFYASYSPTNALYFLEDDCCNDDLGAPNNWFFATSLDAPIKTYYRFKDNYYEIIIRTQTGENSFEETLRRYNYKDQLILEINKNNTKIHYEYFVDGNLKKKGFGDFDIDEVTFIYSNILYEAALDSNNRYIGRTTQEGKSFDYQYCNDLLSKKIINDLHQGQPVNQCFSVEYTHDSFLSDLSNVKFKNFDSIEEEHNYSRPSTSYKTNYFDDTVSKYRINKNINNQSTVLGIYDGYDYVNILTTQKTASVTTRTYNNSYSYGGGDQVVTETFDIYNRPANIIVDSDVMVTFQYESQHASQFCAQLSGITDNFTGRNISYTYGDNNELISIQVGSFILIYSTDGEYSSTEFIFDNSENYLSKVKDNETFYKKANNTINSTYWKYDYDSLLRLSTKLNNKFSRNIFQDYSYSNDCPSRLTQYNYDGTAYSETYSYSQFYGHLTGVSISTTSFSSTSTYQYDGFGRLISETNTKLGINRTYLYKPSSNIPGPLGRMTKFGNKDLIYDDRGRLIEFGDNSYGYDGYGNRIFKNADSYQWTRGHLLSCLGFSRYYYDYRGIRTSKLDSDGLTHNYYYNGSNLVGEDVYNGNTLVRKLRFFYDKDGLCSLRTIIGNQTKDYIYIRNPFKDIVGISEGITLKALYIYDAWGNHKVCNPNGMVNADSSFIGNINPFRYRSYYYDSDTNLYYLKSRYYDSEIGQFISPDDMEHLSMVNVTGINLYAYCQNNPVMNYDPDGHLFLELALIFFSFMTAEQVGGLATSIGGQIAQNGFNLTKWNWADIGGRISDILITDSIIGVSNLIGLANPILGLSIYYALNSTTNAFYYTFLADSNDDITDSSYNNIYLTRWQRLNYIKKLYHGSDAFWFYERMAFGEYSLHMYSYLFFGSGSFGGSVDNASLDYKQLDKRWYVNLFSLIFYILGF
ncbi:MAG: RHS repeat-associated core domain-containing protein [Bacilli bacterium]|nr:RHS repeat-associated core domain-containing protein [Bacilli bacterium]